MTPLWWRKDPFMHAAWKGTAESVVVFFRQTTVADLLKGAGEDLRI